MDDPTPSTLVLPSHRRMPMHLARRFAQICATLQSEQSEPYGLAPWDVGLIAQLELTPGKDRGWLADAIGRDATSTGQSLERLVKRRLVVRETNPTDRRAAAFALTPAGLALREALRGPTLDLARRLLAPLTDREAAVLLDLLTRLIEAHEPYARSGAGRKPPRRNK